MLHQAQTRADCFFLIMPVGQVLIITRLHASRNPLWTAVHIRKKIRKIKSSCNSIDVRTLIPQYEQHQATLIECLYWFSLEGSPVRHHMETHERFSESLRILWWWWFCFQKTSPTNASTNTNNVYKGDIRTGVVLLLRWLHQNSTSLLHWYLIDALSLYTTRLFIDNRLFDHPTPKQENKL